jgi:RimJ/RimL family protein N-acetyltransferase
LLLLGCAFDDAGAQNVVLKTEALNEQSRSAILALGAVEEGVSILDDEWPAVRERNEERLRRRRKK